LVLGFAHSDSVLLAAWENSGGSNSSGGLSNSLLSDWLTEEMGGNASQIPKTASAGSNLDTVA